MRDRLEPAFGDALLDIAERESLSVSDLVNLCAAKYPDLAWRAAVRCWVTTYYREHANAEKPMSADQMKDALRRG